MIQARAKRIRAPDDFHSSLHHCPFSQRLPPAEDVVPVRKWKPILPFEIDESTFNESNARAFSMGIQWDVEHRENDDWHWCVLPALSFLPFYANWEIYPVVSHSVMPRLRVRIEFPRSDRTSKPEESGACQGGSSSSSLHDNHHENYVIDTIESCVYATSKKWFPFLLSSLLDMFLSSETNFHHDADEPPDLKAISINGR